MGKSRVLGMLLGTAMACSSGALAAPQDATATGKAQAPAASEVSATAEKAGKGGASGLAARSAAKGENKSSAHSVEVKRGLATLKSGTAISAQLDKTIDARVVKPGGIVSARVTKDVRHKGHSVIRKGDRLLGRVASTAAGTSDNAASEVAVTFDRLARGDAEYELNTIVSSVISTPGDMGAGILTWPLPGPMIMPDPADRVGGHTGLLEEATATAGSAGSPVGGLGGDLSRAASSTDGAIGPVMGAFDRGSAQSGSALGILTPVRDIRLNSKTGASQRGQMTSLIGARRGNLRLESGTRMQFTVKNQTDFERAEK